MERDRLETVREAHRRLRAALRAAPTGDPGTGAEAGDGAAGLRELLPALRAAESALDPATGADAVLEHGFLAAEMEALARALERPNGGGPSGHARSAAGNALRVGHRIETVLELWLLREEAAGRPQGETEEPRAVAAPPASPAGPGGGPGGFGSSRPMDHDEIDALLREGYWGVLCTAVDGQPYAVPIIYGYDGHDFFVAMRTGRKQRNLDRNPVVCLTIADVGERARSWRSAVVAGRAEWVEDLRGRIHAFDALRRQVGRKAPQSLRDAARLARARVVRVIPESITGRVRVP